MSPTISRTAVLASASVVAASALVFGAVAAASAAPQPRVAAAPDSSSSTATTTAAGVTADITVWLEYDGSAPKIMSISGVPVDSDVELTPWSKGIEYSNPDELCGAVYVDVSLDPKSVEVWGDEEVGCNFTDVTVEVVLNGAEWGTVTIASDNLFTEEGPVFEEPAPDEAAGLTSQGSFRFGRSVVTALSAPYPVLVSATASGSTFRAAWSGTTSGWTLGSATFTFAAAAPGATPVLATPVFTG